MTNDVPVTVAYTTVKTAPRSPPDNDYTTDFAGDADLSAPARSLQTISVPVVGDFEVRGG